MPALRDLQGQTFDRLTVVERGPNGCHGHAQWWCDCICGTRVLLRGSSLYSRNTQSCRCLHQEIMHKRNTTHGMSHLPEYDIWNAMCRRCRDPKNPGYVNYGGRGITVCDAWYNSLLMFYADMGPRPPGDYTLERKNNSLGYDKTNCAWTTRQQQARNTRSNRLLTYQGMTQCVTAWAEDMHVGPDRIFSRLRRRWSVEKALTAPISTKNQYTTTI